MLRICVLSYSLWPLFAELLRFCNAKKVFVCGVCEECGMECAHIFHAVGDYTSCGEFGDVTFVDGKKGEEILRCRQ